MRRLDPTPVEREAVAAGAGDLVARWRVAFRAWAAEWLRRLELDAALLPPARRERTLAEARAVIAATLKKTTRDLAAHRRRKTLTA